ncbi:MAG: NADPH:quinone reductase [Pseudomonadota bacterium]|jgi:NADPH:quinone reductase-like Zn-dependent oxidoreductase
MSIFGWHVGAFGGVEVMHWRELPPLVPGRGQLLVRVHASGINFAETRMRAGTYSGQELPFVMGMESAGVVEAIGPGVTGHAVGDRVFGRARGSHATHVLFDADHALPLPNNIDFVQGAAIPVGWLTAWHALVTIGRARAGERVLIEAIASSVVVRPCKSPNGKAHGLQAPRVATTNANEHVPLVRMPPTTTKLPISLRA